LIREEGLLVGGSSGSVLCAALEAGARLQKGQNCVVVLPDGVRNYLTKFVDNRWMRENGFFETKSIKGKVKDVLERTSRPSLVSIEDTAPVKNVITIMREKGVSQLPVTSGGVLVGIISEGDLLEFVGSNDGYETAIVSRCMNRQVPTVGLETPISTLQEPMRQWNAVVVVSGERSPISIMTRIDLLDYLARSGGKK
jgi:cystathionine beta-synthase